MSRKQKLDEAVGLLIKALPHIPENAMDVDRYRTHKASESYLRDSIRAYVRAWRGPRKARQP